MPRISKPTDNFKERMSEDTPFSWNDFVTDIIKGKYVLLVGSEVMLQKQYGDGDSHKDILDSIVLDLKSENFLGNNFACSSFTELVRKTKRSDVRSLLINSMLGENANYQCTTDVVSEELKNLLRTKFFRIVLTTTFDEYLENVMREIWGNDLRVMNIYDEGKSFDFDGREQSSEEFDIRPTLYYICGKVNAKGKKFAVTENDAIEVVARWFSYRAPENFLKNIRPKGIISIGCKFDDWLFRFIWYILRKDINNIDSNLKDAVAVSFLSESGKKLNDYLKSRNVYTESDARAFIRKIIDNKERCIRDIAAANSQIGGIFVSYAHEDMPIVSSIVDRLKKEGFNVWFDSSKLESGDSYDARISKAIANCKIFIPILSPQVKMDLQNGRADRYYIATEWALARQRARNIEGYNGNIRIMPLAISGYDERAEYHREFPFFEKSVVNLMQIPISQFIEEIKKYID
mgnify:CR=1 FL=1